MLIYLWTMWYHKWKIKQENEYEYTKQEKSDFQYGIVFGILSFMFITKSLRLIRTSFSYQTNCEILSYNT